MSRLVKRTLQEPIRATLDGKDAWLCRCGLSKTQPFCDGSHKLTKGEEAGKLYWYDAGGQRHEVADGFPEIRAY